MIAIFYILAVQYPTNAIARPTEFLRPVGLYHVSYTAMKARGLAKFPIPPIARDNQTKKEVQTSPSGVLTCRPL